MDKNLTIRIDEDLLNKSKELAKKKHINLSALIRILLSEEIEKENNKVLEKQERMQKIQGD